ncbi:MAG: DUF488 domain-containing protein [Haloarculaceae archaeon]
MDSTDRVRETYHAALQHDLVDPGDATLVGVVRRPTGWFSNTVDENHPELGPPEALLSTVKERTEDLKARGMCESGAHNAAWEETGFADRYREHLDADESAGATVEALAERARSGETLYLVCFEADDKRCHRTILQERLRSRL